MNSTTTFETFWYNWCVKQALCCNNKNDIKGWIFWWCDRNRYIYGLTSAEVDCYRKFKTAEYKRIKLDLLSAVNGKPKTVYVKLKKDR